MSTDPDNPDWTEDDFRRAKPAAEVHSPAVVAALSRGTRGHPVEETIYAAIARQARWATASKLAA